MLLATTMFVCMLQFGLHPSRQARPIGREWLVVVPLLTSWGGYTLLIFIFSFAIIRLRITYVIVITWGPESIKKLVEI
jgi:hypothetical protein